MISKLTNFLMILFSIGTASAAVVLTYWQINIANDHNRLSLKPRLDIDFSTIRNSVEQKFGFRLVNSGLGPAKVTRLSITTPKGKFKSFSAFHKAYGWTPDCVESLDLGKTGVAVASGEDLKATRVRKSCFHYVPRPYKKVANEIKIVVNYRSVYGDKFEALY